MLMLKLNEMYLYPKGYEVNLKKVEDFQKMSPYIAAEYVQFTLTLTFVQQIVHQTLNMKPNQTLIISYNILHLNCIDI